MSDERFPARVYKDTVLAPLFEGVKRHHWRYQMEINQASAVLLAERGLLTDTEAREILRALDEILKTIDLDRLSYTGEHRGFLLLRRERADPSAGRGRRRQAAYGPKPQRHRPHGVQDGAEGQAGGAAVGAHRDDRGTARRRRARARHDRRRLYPRPAGAADHLRTLSRRVHRAFAARHGPAASRAAHGRSQQHGRRGDHDVGLQPRPCADRSTPGLRRRAGELVRVHRGRRLRDRRVRGAQARVHPRRTLRAGLEQLDRFRDRALARAGRIRADQLDHAAEAQPGAGRASAPDGVARRRSVRSRADRRAQHAFHRHERFRGRGADRGLRRVRHRAPDDGAPRWIAFGRHDRRREGAKGTSTKRA